MQIKLHKIWLQVKFITQNYNNLWTTCNCCFIYMYVLKKKTKPLVPKLQWRTFCNRNCINLIGFPYINKSNCFDLGQFKFVTLQNYFNMALNATMPSEHIQQIIAMMCFETKHSPLTPLTFGSTELVYCNRWEPIW